MSPNIYIISQEIIYELLQINNLDQDRIDTFCNSNIYPISSTITTDDNYYFIPSLEAKYYMD